MTSFPFRTLFSLGILLAFGGIFTAVDAAAAASASPWIDATHAQVRLIAGGGAGVRRDLRAGIEIKLQPGWKTYWRYPGDAGVPPRFDFARSENVKDIAVLFPAPSRFATDGEQSIGYADHVVLPLRIVPANARKPVIVRLDLDYAVCEKLCLPVQAKLELALPAGDADQEATLAHGEVRVPRPVKVGMAGALAIASVRREPGSPRARVVVDVMAPAGTVDLFAEGPTGQWALPLPEPVADAPPGMRRFAFDLDGAPPGESTERPVLRLTAVTPTDAIETSVHLD